MDGFGEEGGGGDEKIWVKMGRVFVVVMGILVEG